MLIEMIAQVLILIPSPERYEKWTINEIPTQVELTHKSGISVSYDAEQAPCNTIPKSGQMLMKEDSSFDQRCYMILDKQDPQFVRRNPQYWLRIKNSIPKKDLE
jgi:hypothetical protein